MITISRRGRVARARPLAALGAGLLVALAACRNAPAMHIPEPGTRPVTSAEPAAPELPVPAPPGASDAPAPPVGSAARLHTDADVHFVQHMIAHHAQALTMTALVPERTTRDDLRRVAERIAVSQRGEIALMQQWLRARGESVPPVAGAGQAPSTSADQAHAGHAMPAMSDSAHADMPGMLSAAELERLAAARGAEFERLFLEYMIRHHEGALTMVAELFATRGAAQEPEIFQLASEIDADQRAEIQRLRTLQTP